MDEMLALLGNYPPCLLFEQLYLKRLPDDIHIQLVDAKIEDHRQLVKRADVLWSSWDMASISVTEMPSNAEHPFPKLWALPESLISSAITTVLLVKQPDCADNHAAGPEETGPVAS